MAPRKKQNVVKKKPVRRTRQIKKLGPRCTTSTTTFQCKHTVKKPKATCPHCKGAGRIVKKKLKRKPPSYFPYFFQHVAKRARDGNVVQLRKITMKRAAECWRTLTDEQRDEFKVKVDRNLGIGGARPKSSGPRPGPGKRSGLWSENQEDKGLAVSCNRDANRDTHQDVKPSASDCNVETSTSNDPKPGKQRSDGDDAPNKGSAPNEGSAPNDDNSRPFPPFGRWAPTGKFI